MKFVTHSSAYYQDPVTLFPADINRGLVTLVEISLLGSDTYANISVQL